VCGCEFKMELSKVSPSMQLSLSFLIYGRRTAIGLKVYLLDPIRTLKENFKTLRHLLFTAARAFTGRGQEQCKTWTRPKIAAETLENMRKGNMVSVSDVNGVHSANKTSGGEETYELGENPEDVGFDSASPYQQTFPVPKESKSEAVPQMEVMTQQLPDPTSLKKKADCLNPKPRAQQWRTDGQPEDIKKLRQQAKDAIKDKQAQCDREEEEEDKKERAKVLDGEQSIDVQSKTSTVAPKAKVADGAQPGISSLKAHNVVSVRADDTRCPSTKAIIAATVKKCQQQLTKFVVDKVSKHSKAVQTHLYRGKRLFEEMKHRVNQAIKSNQCSSLRKMRSGVETVLGEFSHHDQTVSIQGD